MRTQCADHVVARPSESREPASAARPSDQGFRWPRRLATGQSVRVALLNETGVAPPRGRRAIPRNEAEAELRCIAQQKIDLPEGARVSGGPEECPACGAPDVVWGCGVEVSITKEQVHPLVWHETEWMADTFICRTCHAGWIESDDAGPITWVRPYWRLDE